MLVEAATSHRGSGGQEPHKCRELSGEGGNFQMKRWSLVWGLHSCWGPCLDIFVPFYRLKLSADSNGVVFSANLLSWLNKSIHRGSD
jgi:hypothetical protein